MMLGDTPAIRRALSYGKFVRGRPRRVLVLDTRYHLQAECAQALEALGHQARRVVLDGLSCAETLATVIAQLLNFRPDFVLTVNHLGFDDSNQLGALCEACQIPIACWYCDSPFFVLKGAAMPAPTMTSLFVWERTLMTPLRHLGATDVHHLPLGCGLEAFASTDAAWESPSYPVAFVGHSMREAKAQWSAQLNPQEMALKQTFSHQLAEEPRRPCVDTALVRRREHRGLRVLEAFGAATFDATLAYRDRVLACVPPESLHVFGDEHWRGALSAQVHLHGTVPYGRPLAETYRKAAINLNATSLQMPTAVNQRVFDAPISGGFVLNDAQADLELLFEVGTEAIAYSAPAELESLLRFYRHRHSARQRVVHKARQRIMACHTYRHRLTRVVDILERRFA